MKTIIPFCGKIAAMLLLFFLPQMLSASEIGNIDESTVELELIGNSFDIFCDTANQHDFDAVLNNPSWFITNTDPAAFNRTSNATYWLRFQIKNQKGNTKRFILESAAPHTDTVTLFVMKDGVWKSFTSGEGFDFYDRAFKIKNLILDMPVPDDDQVHTFYLRIQSKKYSNFQYRIRSYPFFMEYMTVEYFLLGLYYGILLILAVYNLILFFTIREKVYLYYILYVCSGMLATMADDGLGFQFIWFSMPEIIQPFTYYVIPMMLMFSFLVYASSFLEIWQRDRFAFYVVIGCTAIYLTYFGLSLAFSGGSLPILYLLPFLSVYAMAFRVYLKGYKPALFFISGYTFILLGILILQLRAEHLIEGNIFTVYVLNIAYIIEAVIFSHSLSYRFRVMKEEKEKTQQALIEKLEENQELQQKVNRELDQKVKERTAELNQKNSQLEEANKRLEELNEHVNSMNVKLDYDNWYLKKDVQEHVQARVLDEEVSYEEFTKIFPDEASCFSFLEQKKWGEHYACKKCGNTKYNPVSGSLSRKCTRCGNIESAMAYTLFHGVKFPLHKAFYITYLVSKKGDGITSSELGSLLDMRKNTCWSFKRKVLDRLTELDKNKKGKNSRRWEAIIFSDGK